MTEKQMSTEDKKNIVRKTRSESHEQEANAPGGERGAMAMLQQQVGNRAVQRLLAQRSGDGGFELDDSTTGRINSQRGGGQALDAGVQAKMGDATGHDFSGVKVHTDAESHTLNEQLGARAFTTGQDIFFRSGEYNPGSSGGQELLAHELTHVAQQGSGRVSGGGSGKMTVNDPGDVYEQEADSVAKSVTANAPAAGVQRQEEEEDVQAKRIQRQEEEEMVMPKLQRQEEDEEMAQTKLQRQEEEEMDMPKLQRQEEEEEMAMPKLQRQEEEEEMAQTKLQRQEAEEEEMVA